MTATHNINNTVLVPYLIAEKVTDNLRIQTILIEKSEKVYAKNEVWRNQLNTSADPRQFLKMFMEHWMKKELKVKAR
jgi:hypothetical protein